MRAIPLGRDALHGDLSTIWMHFDWVHHFYNAFAGKRFKNCLSICLRQIRLTKDKDD